MHKWNTSSSNSEHGSNNSSDGTLKKVPELASHTDTDTNNTSRGENGIRAMSRGIYMDMVTVCHSETMDSVFPHWLRLAYRGGGESYSPYDLNMPASLPRRPVAHFQVDHPITEHGMTTAGIVGIGLKQTDYVPFVIYSSPELRCVQTAAAIAARLDSTYTSICIEPSLADWAMWQEPGVQEAWMTPRQLGYLGYPIDLGYMPFLKAVPLEENAIDYLNRLTQFYVQVRNNSVDKVVLFVANPAAVVLAREGTWSNAEQLKGFVDDVSPCTVHSLRVGNKQMLHNENENSVLHHFTRTVTGRILKEKRVAAH